MAPANGVASAFHIKTPPTVAAVVIHKTSSILVIFDSIICLPLKVTGPLISLSLIPRARAPKHIIACRLAQTSNKDGTMTKLTLALTDTAVLFGGFLVKSDATALPGLVDPPAVTKNYLSIQKAGCFLDGRYCRAGFH